MPLHKFHASLCMSYTIEMLQKRRTEPYARCTLSSGIDVMRRLFSSARDTTVAFVLASVGTLLGTAVAWVLLSQQLGQGGWQASTAFSPAVSTRPWIICHPAGAA